MNRPVHPGRHARLATAALAAAIASLAAPAQAAYVLTSFAATSWGVSDASLGLAPGAVIEDFEDVTLASGLTIASSGSNTGSYGPTATLPRTFDPRPTSLGGDDGFGNAFWSYPCGSSACSSLWDGSHALINTGTNGSANYGTTVWADITLSFAGGATQVGFSLHQNEFGVNVIVNGTQTFTLPSGGGGRSGYFRIDATGSSAPITSIVLDGNGGDAWVIDHLAFASAVPEPASWALGLAGAAVLASLARRRAR